MNLIGLVLTVVTVVAIGAGYAITRQHPGSNGAMTDDHTTLSYKDTLDAAEDAANMMESHDTEMNGMMVEGATPGADMVVEEDGHMHDSMMDDHMMSQGSYEAYAPEKFAKAHDGHVVLFFRASWCPTCKALDSDIKGHMSDIPEGVTILDVNYDTETALKQKYGVTYQHTLVEVDSQGNMISKWSGSPTLSELVSHL